MTSETHEFRPGDVVVLVRTDDPHTRLRPGARGRVVRVRPGQVDVRWEDGSSLSMLLDAGDDIELAHRGAGGRL